MSYDLIPVCTEIICLLRKEPIMYFKSRDYSGKRISIEVLGSFAIPKQAVKGAAVVSF